MKAVRHLRFSTARQVFDAYAPVREDIAAEPGDAPPLVFLDSLMKGPTPEDAISFCSYLLPKREAVWWACESIRSIAPPVSESDKHLLDLSEQWVRVPEEEKRVAAKAAGMAAVVKNAPAWVALAAAWSGGSMVDDPERPVPPPDFLTAKAVRAAILTALAQSAPKDRSQKLEATVQRALKLVNGGAS